MTSLLTFQIDIFLFKFLWAIQFNYNRNVNKIHFIEIKVFDFYDKFWTLSTLQGLIKVTQMSKENLYVSMILKIGIAKLKSN